MLNFIKAFGVFLFWSAIGMAYLHYTDAFEKYKSYNDGFDVEEVNFTSELSAEQVDKFRLAKGEIIPVCHKPEV